VDFGKSSERVKKLRDRLVGFTPTTCIERARIVTNFYKRKDIFKYPAVIQRAFVIDEIVRKMSIIINEDELIVGNRGLILDRELFSQRCLLIGLKRN